MLLRRASRLSRLSRLSSSGPRISELGEEEAQFRHKSMYPQRERILFSLAYELRQHEEKLVNHPVLESLQCLPKAIWQTAPLLRQGKSMNDLQYELSMWNGGGSSEFVPRLIWKKRVKLVGAETKMEKVKRP